MRKQWASAAHRRHLHRHRHRHRRGNCYFVRFFFFSFFLVRVLLLGIVANNDNDKNKNKNPLLAVELPFAIFGNAPDDSLLAAAAGPAAASDRLSLLQGNDELLVAQKQKQQKQQQRRRRTTNVVNLRNDDDEEQEVEEARLVWNFHVLFSGHVWDDFVSFPVFQLCNWVRNTNEKKNNLIRPLEQQEGASRGRSSIYYNTTGTALPEDVLLTPNGKVRFVLNMPCQQIMKRHRSGAGNWVLHNYLLRMAVMHSVTQVAKNASSVQVTVDTLCLDDDDDDSEEVAKTLVLPWLTGYFTGKDDLEVVQEYWQSALSIYDNTEAVKVETTCARHQEGAWYSSPFLFMLPIIRNDLRRMAVKLIGPPSEDPTHPAHAFLHSLSTTTTTTTIHRRGVADNKNTTFEPLLTDVEWDQVVIHFRCGDVMVSRWDMFHFVKFRTFAEKIPRNTKSIGIVTQPFGDDEHNDDDPTASKNKTTKKTINLQTRADDVRDIYRTNLCKSVTVSFQKYLEDRFPLARVTIRNDPDETIALAYARLVMAYHSFAAPDSTFSLFPVLASFGTGYHIRAIEGGMNQGLNDYAFLVKHDPFVVFLDPDTILPVERTNVLRKENAERAKHDILTWFQNDTFEIDGLNGFDWMAKYEE